MIQLDFLDADGNIVKDNVFLDMVFYTKRSKATHRVWRCNAVHGKCLNDSILSGRALQTPLPSVIFKFRESDVSIMWWWRDAGR